MKGYWAEHSRPTCAAMGKINFFVTFFSRAHLSVCVLDGGNVAVAKRSFDEPQHQRTLANTARPEHNNPIVVALLRHIYFEIYF